MNPRDSTHPKKKKETSTKKASEGTRKRPSRLAATAASPRPAAQAPVAKAKPTPSQNDAPTAAVGHQALARRAVGRGVRHGFTSPPLQPEPTQPEATTSTLVAAARHPQANSDNLTELATNYRNVLNEGRAAAVSTSNPSNDNTSNDPTPLSQMQRSNYDSGTFGGFLSRNSSLVDLAMLAPVADEEPPPSDNTGDGFGFVDFPNPEIYPSNHDASGN